MIATDDDKQKEVAEETPNTLYEIVKQLMLALVDANESSKPGIRTPAPKIITPLIDTIRYEAASTISIVWKELILSNQQVCYLKRIY
jgi:hypothetical protein